MLRKFVKLYYRIRGYRWSAKKHGEIKIARVTSQFSTMMEDLQEGTEELRQHKLNNDDLKKQIDKENVKLEAKMKETKAMAEFIGKMTTSA